MSVQELQELLANPVMVSKQHYCCLSATTLPTSDDTMRSAASNALLEKLLLWSKPHVDTQKFTRVSTVSFSAV